MIRKLATPGSGGVRKPPPRKQTTQPMPPSDEKGRAPGDTGAAPMGAEPNEQHARNSAPSSIRVIAERVAQLKAKPHRTTKLTLTIVLIGALLEPLMRLLGHGLAEMLHTLIILF